MTTRRAQVWHAPWDDRELRTQVLLTHPIPWSALPYDRYIHVATVTLPDDDGLALPLDSVYRMTNSIDTPWHENEGVESHVGATRSTSVGDLILLPDHSLWGVESVGFHLLRRWVLDPRQGIADPPTTSSVRGPSRRGTLRRVPKAVDGA